MFLLGNISPKNMKKIALLCLGLLSFVFYSCQNTQATNKKDAEYAREEERSSTRNNDRKNAKDQKVPNIRMKDVNGNEIELYAVLKKHKYVLIDFWASWCGPCRAENPNVVNAYNAYKGKGFTIFSVSLDNDQGKWIKAIEKDGLAWEYHVSDLKGWDNAAAVEYGVDGIPMNYLVDSEGNVVSANLRGETLEEALSKVLNP